MLHFRYNIRKLVIRISPQTSPQPHQKNLATILPRCQVRCICDWTLHVPVPRFPSFPPGLLICCYHRAHSQGNLASRTHHHPGTVSRGRRCLSPIFRRDRFQHVMKPIPETAALSKRTHGLRIASILRGVSFLLFSSRFEPHSSQFY